MTHANHSLGRSLGLLTLVSASAACNAIFGLDEKALGGDAGTTHEDAKTTVHDGGGSTSDAPTATGCTADDAGYHSIQNTACWSTFVVPAALDSEPSYSGGAFDGRYTYFASNMDGMVLRYDTKADFGTSTAWSSFDTSGIPDLAQAGSQAYGGLVFDGQYVYLVPNNPGMSFVRYDTRSSFTAGASWTAYTPNTSDPVSYSGGTFDGRYVYFAPADDIEEELSGLVARYDTKAAFKDGVAGWQTYDLTALNISAGEFNGAIFDGRYVYFPANDVQTDPNGDDTSVAARFDTMAPFASASSWSFFDLGTLPDSNLIAGFQSGIYDGTDVYFVPSPASGVVVRFDPTASFTSASSWSTYAPEPNAGSIGTSFTPQFGVGAFDGRHLFFVPQANEGSGTNGLFVQHDLTAGAFSTPSTWSSFDTTKIKAANFGAAVFDGRYLYLPPGIAGGSAVARFDAKATSAQPDLPSYSGSFF